jgi:predicted nucleotidyltransferase
MEMGADEAQANPHAERIQEQLPFAPDSGAAIIMTAYAGSLAHGTHDPRPGSIDDVDIVGVILAPPAQIIGVTRFEHWDIFIDELDLTFYSVQKFVRLLLKANPNVLGWLWLPDRLYLQRSPAFDRFREQRQIFASKRAYLPFKRYGQAQMRDMDKGVYRGYMGAKRKVLVEQFGYDVKHAAHLIRLLRGACEFLETGEMRVDRSEIDADELKAIKRGDWGRERVLREAEALFVRLEEAYQHSPLPDEPDETAAEELLVDVTLAHLNERVVQSRQQRQFV